MDFIAYAAIAYLIVQLLVSLTNLLSRPYLGRGIPQSTRLVSILIPARNEAAHIGNLLDDLLGSEYGFFEVLVYDDNSSDATGAIVTEKCRQDSRIRYLRGDELPDGWLGKNHACHQLAQAATGDFLLFLDADVRVDNTLLNDSLALMEKNSLGLLSLFPVQVMRSTGEWLTVPVMNRILLANLPLVLVRKSKLSGFSAANGQFMMFNAGTYKKYYYHEKLKSEKVEDIRIIRYMKKIGLPVQTLLSTGQVRCRMYSGFGEAVNGFAKNIHAFFGKNWLILFLYICLTTLGPFAVWASFSFPGLIAYLAGLILLRIIISRLSYQSGLINVILLPFQQITVILLSIVSAYSHIFGKLSWKGRRL